MRYRTDYSAQALTAAPAVLELDGWQLHYQAFAHRADDPRSPVLLLGGAFQSFRSFASEVSELLAEHPATLHPGLSLVRREFPTPIGPVDLMCRDGDGLSVAVEIKRRGEIDGVEQLTRYLELLNRDPLLTGKGAVRGIFAAQQIKPQARVLAEDRGITCAVVDYDALRGLDNAEDRLF